MKEGIEKKDSKGKHQNPRTIRKEIQFSDSEFALVSQKALEAKLYPAVYIREASLGHELKAAMTPEEEALYKRSTNYSSRYTNNLNQLMRLANTYHELLDSPVFADAIVQFVQNADKHLQGEEYVPIDTYSLELELKKLEREVSARSNFSESENHALQEENERQRNEIKKLKNEKSSLIDKLQEMAKYYLFTKAGEEEYIERHNILLYPSTGMGCSWFFKIGDDPAYELPQAIVSKWHEKSYSIADIHQHYLKHINNH